MSVATAATSPQTSSVRVLIADDDPPSAELLELYLADSGYTTQTAADGEEALRKVEAWRPDVILLDVMMPKISGFEVCKRLRSAPATSGTAVLMITALDQKADVERAVDAGTDDFITKPINKTDLLLRIRALLSSRGEQRELDRTLRYMEGVDDPESV
jgi:DNA-binding response OmpR family regulator